MAEKTSIFSNDHPFKIIFMAVALCLVGSVLVSAAAIGLLRTACAPFLGQAPQS